jgi:hypothetical protein
VRQYFYQITLPWSDEGFRLLPSNLYFDLTTRMREFEASFEQGMESFIQVYPQYIEQVRPELNGLFREEDYPAAEKLRKKFGVKLDSDVAASGKLNDWRHTKGIEPLRTKEEGEVSEKSARNDIDNVGETRTARNRSVFRLQIHLWSCDSTRERYNSDKSVPKKEIPVKACPARSRRVPEMAGKKCGAERIPVMALHLSCRL